MKVYVITQESEDDGWCGTSVFASRAKAAANVNELIDELNKDRKENKLNHIMWPERVRDVQFRAGRYVLHCAEHNLEK